jgi:hypothetical protein
MTLNDFTVGDRVEYILPKSAAHGRPVTLYEPATIEKITRSRLIVRIDRWPKRTRATVPSQVKKVSL